MAGESSSGRNADIAKSVFIEDVDAYMQGKAVEDVLLELQERLRRLRTYEGQVRFCAPCAAACESRPCAMAGAARCRSACAACALVAAR